ncbi:helix-turn-helix transcriptional regulator [Flavilitoribacter nigricans]|uniref:Uncharacterized protein n=1 Tax=Flavilitoribacter nigricans (strain ATCC 23147 / DSM 23189 / NBRC 102662 / NCIMB 1420 / SS-2) TaxID=1122177 RepID=A0A2D0MXB8_FLAN2|nr:WYL domain-containing protein [Flavilitoribacter nigricans]PHN00798.1 hypothetical protein CRP01_40365 [Flavilitoribacter nigricans DSM 23189 = NBRC 102662]
MGRNSNASSRYQRINEIFNLRKGRNALVTTRELVNILGVSTRQLRTDMDQMKLMGAPLEYDAKDRGWRYTHPFDISEPIPLSVEDIMQLRLAVATLAQFNQVPGFENLSGIFEKIRKSVRRWLDREATTKAIYFDPLPNYEGARNLPFFLRAIEETREVQFEYRPFLASQSRSCRIDPYFLRQHHQGWYLGGFSHDPNELFIRTYPLERVVGEPVFTGTFFNRPENFRPAEYWKYIVGINRPPDKGIEKVVLEFNYLHGRYFLSKPFYEPFIILEESAEKLTVEMELIIDIELTRKILALGSDVKVIAPESLRASIKKFLEDALAHYYT